jgi:hypothetical protein
VFSTLGSIITPKISNDIRFMEKDEGVSLEMADAQLPLFHLIATGLN